MPTNRPGYKKGYMRLRRIALIDILGGSCRKCGTDKNLEFHHVDGSGEHGIGTEKQIREIEAHLADDDFPVILLCRECHQIEHKLIAEKRLKI
jgi:hypothetical protein